MDVGASTEQLALAGSPRLDHKVLSKPPRHTWNLEQRIALCVLKRWYAPSYRDIHSVFNAHYASSINKQNPGHQIGRNAILAQLHDMEAQGEDNAAWRSVMLETGFGDPQGHYENTRKDLEATAGEIAVVLLRGWEDEYKISARSGSGRSPRKRKRQSNWEGVLGFMRDDDEENLPYTPSKKRHGLLTPSTSPQGRVQNRQVRQNNQRRRHGARPITPPPDDPVNTLNYRFIPPDLGFRFWDDFSHGLNTPHGFLAGAFLNHSGNIPSPPDRSHQDFRNKIDIHLRPLEEPSAYISVWESLAPALHRGLRSTANAHIAIINLQAIYQDQLSGLPGLYPAAAAVKQLRLMGGDWAYRGRSEWLVWGECKPHTVVASLSVANLRRFLESVPSVLPTLRLDSIEGSLGAKEYRKLLNQSQLPLSKASGRAIGEFLAFTRLPELFVDFAALKIARSWYFLGLRDPRRQAAYLCGVYEGYRPVTETSRNTLHDRQTSITSVAASFAAANEPEDTFQVRRAEIESIIAGCEQSTEGLRMQVHGRLRSVTASFRAATEPEDAFQVRRAAIQSTIAGCEQVTEGLHVQVRGRQFDGTTGTSEAEIEIDDFLIQRRRIESILCLQGSHL